MTHRTLHAAVVAALVAGGAWSLHATNTFPELRIGSTVYTNVKVSNQTSNDVYIRHSGGFANLKVSDLPRDVQALLGYEVEPTPVAQASFDLNSLKEDPRIQAVQQQLMQQMEGSVLKLNPPLVAGILVASFVIYLFFCYCSLLICKNAGTEPGSLVWLPVLQMFPLLRAARMSAWWFLAFFLPVLNIVASVVWCLKIAEACGKSAVVGVLLLLPIVGPLTYLYLAFSGERDSAASMQPIKLKLGAT
jgi:hypothetical protein